MPQLNAYARYRANELLLSHWKPDAVAADIHCHTSTIYEIERTRQMYGTPYRPPEVLQKRGRKKAIHQAAKEGLLEYQATRPWLYQDELVEYLKQEWDISLHKSNLSRLLKQEALSRKQGQRVGPQSQELREGWQAEMVCKIPAMWLLCSSSC